VEGGGEAAAEGGQASFSNGFEESRAEPAEPREFREPRESSPPPQSESRPEPREIAAASGESHRPASQFEPPPAPESDDRKPYVVWTSAPSSDHSGGGREE
jgi:hypothetical protein